MGDCRGHARHPTTVVDEALSVGGVPVLSSNGAGPAGAVQSGLSGLVADSSVARRISIIWALLLFNGLGTLPGSVLRIPRPVQQVLTMAALGLALLLAMILNRGLVVRPNLLLGLSTLLAGTALMTAVRLTAGPGAVLRSVRLFAFLAVLWLLTPWWDRRDLLLARCHLRALVAVCGLIVLGLVLFPSAALSGSFPTGRLTGVLWPIPAPQVAEYAAVTAGMAIVLWLSGSMARRPALLLACGGLAMVLASRTRTALGALAAGVVLAALTLLLNRHLVRRVAKAALVVLPLAAVLLAPALSGWFHRNQSADQIRGLTGRTKVWAMVASEPRPELNQWFGYGLSDKSFAGLPIDSTWLAVYQDQGLFGVVVVAGILLFLAVASILRRAGPERALAIFLVVYCAVASYTEVGLGDASPYLLHMVVAASLVTGIHTRRQPLDDEASAAQGAGLA